LGRFTLGAKNLNWSKFINSNFFFNGSFVIGPLTTNFSYLLLGWA
jgi:hypothetical protein